MVSRILYRRLVPIATVTTLIVGCLELDTVPPPTTMEGSSSSSSAESSSGSGESSSGFSMTTSSSSAAASSSGTPVMHEVVAKSNLGMTLQNNSGAVACATDARMLPDGMTGNALECTHITEMNGAFYHGLTADLTVDVMYVFSFFFRNGNFDTPFGQDPTSIGVSVISPNGSGSGALIMLDPYADGWYRQRFLFTATATGTHKLGFTHSLSRMPGGGYWLYGFQVETGFEVTDYVPE